MKHALIIGASGGVGGGIARQLQAEHWQVSRLSRSGDGLDLTDEASVQDHMDRISGPYDLILIATGALEINGARPEKSLSQISAQAMMDQFALNTVGPALVLRHAKRLLPKDRPAAIAALSARVGSIGDNHLGGWTSYRASKAALNQVIRCAAIELGRTHKHAACVALHPGTVATKFTERYQTRHPTVTPAQAAQNLLRVISKLTPEQTGRFFDWAGKGIPW
ncbi:SDR family NAD(P)-dependent oxidoreductase [Tropicibacter sp. R15_0]|uniref:SDR family NAD(P)-dependent oxidoreductase n=1 Tax=Tropicibacter sp. R15_0 TaxID=2821101 RepID=UPI001ADA2EA6|nr:SDR family NAD(P)-dependent oxidoreductase [Tropicibacter sp. R15_0]MBO9464120.1 SDR family NAD(P)-dependent oxidoreductase [Tropicibacter sp. R15_0]